MSVKRPDAADLIALDPALQGASVADDLPEVGTEVVVEGGDLLGLGGAEGEDEVLDLEA